MAGHQDARRAGDDTNVVSEEERLAYLAAYHVLDTAREDAFDRLVRMVRSAFDAPVALLSFIDRDRQWFKSEIGLDATEAPREIAFCDTTICTDLPLLISDAAADPRFADYPYVAGEPHVRSYAGAPLTVAPGVRIGTIGIVDFKPRSFSAAEVEMLVDLSRVVVHELELKKAVREAEAARDQLHAAIEALPDGFVLFDEQDRLVLFNERMRELYPEAAQSLRLGRSFEAVIREAVALGGFPEASGREEQWIRERIAHHKNPVGLVEQRTASGGWVRINERKTETGATVGFRTDITAVKQREEELFELATRDALTGVLTRRSILDELEHELARAQRYATGCSVLVLDIDHFKQVNDRCGHQAGDEVLKAITECIIGTIRGVDRVGRLGGEEFMVLLSDTDMPGAMLTAERLRRAVEAVSVMCRTTRSEPIDVRVTVSVGVADFRYGETADDLYARADDSLYKAKAAGRNRIHGDCDTELWGASLDIAG